MEYFLTDYGGTVKPIIEVIDEWGKQYRSRLINEMKGR
ncbi:winged helix-turn-helix transcriptional regulator [Pedobacter sp. MC2016-15]|nr:winged helix-turn-helix transcriptional regulator [Pedobacter sp. MC2016-15]MCX2481627.1 winged helix-turn-helix transcriptional regulator [Pedobacter sp. MC2016-15]